MRARSVLVHSLWLIAVAALWGFTNPFLKKGGKGIERVQSSSRLLQVFHELLFLVFNWNYMLPFVVNQSGSLLYYFTLSSVELSLAVPVTNALTLVFTAIAGRLIGEVVELRTYIGTVVIMTGITLCVLGKT